MLLRQFCVALGGHEEAVASEEGGAKGGVDKESCPQEGRGEEGGREGSACKGGEEGCAGQEGGGEVRSTCTGDRTAAGGDCRLEGSAGLNPLPGVANL